ncbi:Aldo/keto reductase [Fomitiporia mediterranea MF3/22]|uniref:Aldo/keto reductase n=1 Tax=Fomitiporia mediterranea (strain MF3/22) TaxID=694068 RepID=UPI000440935E|nr:Aldo/keto reductase [Fomitiporia mediterranea MF3/22]EJC98432.1 Aldo/keto reductase [Fomitiporia mediterranea MF3/22]
MYLAFAGFRSLKSSSLRLGWSSCHRHSSLKAGLSTLPSHFDLPSGDRIPSVALGVWKAGKGEVGPAVKTALKAGYHHIDDAWIYRNEGEVGQAIKESGVPRTDIWLTSKLWNSFHAHEDVEQALDESLNSLGTEYLDLYLMHWPIAFKKGTGPDGKSVYDPELSENPYPTWQKLEEMVEKGKVRNIGISNFNIRRIQNLTANPLKVKPAVLQVELSFWNPQPELVKWTKENDLPVEAYSPLGGSKQVKETLREPTINKIANQLGMTPAQVVISWHVQRGTIVLPKSVTPSRIRENFEIRALPDDLFEELEAAAVLHKPMRTVNPSKDWGLDFDIFDD